MTVETPVLPGTGVSVRVRGPRVGPVMARFPTGITAVFDEAALKTMSGPSGSVNVSVRVSGDVSPPATSAIASSTGGSFTAVTLNVKLRCDSPLPASRTRTVITVLPTALATGVTVSVRPAPLPVNTRPERDTMSAREVVALSASAATGVVSSPMVNGIGTTVSSGTVTSARLVMEGGGLATPSMRRRRRLKLSATMSRPADVEQQAARGIERRQPGRAAVARELARHREAGQDELPGAREGLHDAVPDREHLVVARQVHGAVGPGGQAGRAWEGLLRRDAALGRDSQGARPGHREDLVQ